MELLDAFQNKWHTIFDMQGNLYQVFVCKANMHDSKESARSADSVLRKHKHVKKVLADLGYRGLF